MAHRSEKKPIRLQCDHQPLSADRCLRSALPRLTKCEFHAPPEAVRIAMEQLEAAAESKKGNVR